MPHTNQGRTGKIQSNEKTRKLPSIKIPESSISPRIDTNKGITQETVPIRVDSPKEATFSTQTKTQLAESQTLTHVKTK